MSRLEDLNPGVIVKGILSDDVVTIIATKYHGNSVAEIIFKDSKGNIANQLLYREDESKILILDSDSKWTFDGDPKTLRLILEANRIRLAHLFDPYLAVHTSAIQPLPHQITAVYQEMLPRLPIRYILADDPGAGKTIMTGLLIKEMVARGDLKRCLIVSPGNLTEQWQDELHTKFNINFEILTNERIESSPSGNIFNEMDLCIARLDKLSRDDKLIEKLVKTEWDLIVCDEAHKMSATLYKDDVKKTLRYKLGEELSSITRNLVLLTATPHNGKEEDFQLFLKLIDPDRFEGVNRTQDFEKDVHDVMRRMVKEELLKFDGTPLFPERCAYTVNYSLSPKERELYEHVTNYVKEEFNRIDKVDKKKKTTVGFALTVLQRRLASSPEAIYQSLHRRRERLEKRVLHFSEKQRLYSDNFSLHIEDYDDLPDIERENFDDELLDEASAANTIEELKQEIEILKKLELEAEKVRLSNEDRKWDELSKLLQQNSIMYNSEGNREKIIIFTEHKDTLNYLKSKIESLLGTPGAVVSIHGGMRREERKSNETAFKEDKNVLVMIATDAAGEGINLQRAHLMINYDLPWNPNRLEQRFGRIHRIGQTEVCHLWNLVSNETREGNVFQRLFDKLEEERKTLGGKVFNILGKVTFDEKPLRELLIEAIRYGEKPEVRAHLHEVVDTSLNQESLIKLLEERALTNDVLDAGLISKIREDMERVEAHKLQPHFIESFFIEAFRHVGGRIESREKGKYEIVTVPISIKNTNKNVNSRNPIANRYQRICFDQKYVDVEGEKTATLMCPGHPLMDTLVDIICNEFSDTLRRGSVLIDDSEFNNELRVLFYVESSIQDGIVSKGKNRIISKKMNFLEIDDKGNVNDAGFAPYLDYRPPEDLELKAIKNILIEKNISLDDIEDKAYTFAVTDLISTNLESVRSKRLISLNKTRNMVKNRLTSEIQYWDKRASELKKEELAGKPITKINSEKATQRADELNRRLQARMIEIDKESNMSALPPVISGGALIVPKHMITQTSNMELDTFEFNNSYIEKIAMDAVYNLELELGYAPKDVSAKKCGYDIESEIPNKLRTGNTCLRFIEVKGRRFDADTITVSKNEILTGLNKPENFILAVVQVSGHDLHITYFKDAFHEPPDFCANSVNFNLNQLKKNSKIILERDANV